jgi:hypothetical protein
MTLYHPPYTHTHMCVCVCVCTVVRYSAHQCLASFWLCKQQNRTQFTFFILVSHSDVECYRESNCSFPCHFPPFHSRQYILPHACWTGVFQLFPQSRGQFVVVVVVVVSSKYLQSYDNSTVTQPRSQTHTKVGKLGLQNTHNGHVGNIIKEKKFSY